MTAIRFPAILGGQPRQTSTTSFEKNTAGLIHVAKRAYRRGAGGIAKFQPPDYSGFFGKIQADSRLPKNRPS